MPDAFLHYCHEPACQEKTAGRFCPTHARATTQRYDRQRGTAAARGYDRRWQRYVARFRARYPLCGDRPAEAPATTDSVCQAARIIRPMYVVDHIVPVTGPDDPTFYRPANHQALCESCHNAKRRRERGDTHSKDLTIMAKQQPHRADRVDERRDTREDRQDDREQQRDDRHEDRRHDEAVPVPADEDPTDG